MNERGPGSDDAIAASSGAAGALRTRLDQALVARGLVATRARARDLVLRGKVTVDGRLASRPALMVGAASRLDVEPGAADYVSRGALKLRAALDALALDPSGRIGIDIGAAHGGFTEVLLERGASKVYAVDNGHGQLDRRLADDPRVVNLESTDARLLGAAHVPEPVGIIVADVSFVSLAKVLAAALALAAPGAVLAVLVKPQFEVGPALVGKDGVVRDPAARQRALDEFVAWLCRQPGWRLLGTLPSPIEGGSGNLEFLVGAVKDG